MSDSEKSLDSDVVNDDLGLSDGVFEYQREEKTGSSDRKRKQRPAERSNEEMEKYMHSLEQENAGLQQENDDLRAQIKRFAPSLSPLAANGASVSSATQFIDTNKLKLLEFAAFIESKQDTDKRHYLFRVSDADKKSERVKVSEVANVFPALVELINQAPDAVYLVKALVDINYQEAASNAYFYSSRFESCDDNLDIILTTKIWSLGQAVAEQSENTTIKHDQLLGKCIHQSQDAPMCSFVIDMLKAVKDDRKMTLEHFGIAQTVVAKNNAELLLCVCYLFGISESSPSAVAQSALYRVCC